MRSTFFDQMEMNRVLADDLLEHSESWIEDVKTFKRSAERLLEHPFLAALGALDGCRGEVTLERSETEVPAPVGILLYELAECTEQGQICEILARASGGLVDLKKAAPLIRWAGLSGAKDDSGLAKNLGTRLLRTGRWVRCGESVLRWKDWGSPNRQSVEAVGSACDISFAEELVPAKDARNGKHDSCPEPGLGLRHADLDVDDDSVLNR